MFQTLYVLFFISRFVLTTECIKIIDFLDNAATWLNPGDDVLISKTTPIYFVSKTGQNLQFRKKSYLFNDIMERSRSKLEKANSLLTPSESSNSKTESSDGIPDTVYPEILVMVSYELFEKFKLDIEELVPYIYILICAVNLNFRGIESPKFRLNIAGLVVAEDANAFDFIKSNTGTLLANNETYLFSLNALSDSGKWLYTHKDKIPVDSYDVVLTLSSLQFCPDFENTEHCENLEFYGISYERSACAVSDYYKLVEKVSVVSHQGVYDRINTITHELGHMFGASHDGETGFCADESGFMMTSSADYRNINDWSYCSLFQFEKYLKNEGSCMFNKPKSGPTFPTYLPGKVMDANEQCKNTRWPYGCSRMGDSFCSNFKCQKYENNQRQRCRIMDYTAPAGTPCGEDKICFNKMCISENLIVT